MTKERAPFLWKVVSDREGLQPPSIEPMPFSLSSRRSRGICSLRTFPGNVFQTNLRTPSARQGLRACERLPSVQYATPHSERSRSRQSLETSVAARYPSTDAHAMRER